MFACCCGKAAEVEEGATAVLSASTGRQGIFPFRICLGHRQVQLDDGCLSVGMPQPSQLWQRLLPLLPAAQISDSALSGILLSDP